MLCKFIIALIATRHRHDGTSSIARQHIFRDPHRNFLPVKWIYTICAGKNAGDLFLCHPLALTPAVHISKIFVYRFSLVRTRNLCHQLMFRRNHHEINTKNGIWPRCINLQILIKSIDHKIDLRTITLADPVGLHLFHAVTEFNRFQSGDQPVCILRDPQVPLAQLLTHHRKTTALTHAIDHFIIGEDCTEGLAPIHFAVATKGQAVLHKNFLLLPFTESFPICCTKTKISVTRAFMCSITSRFKQAYQCCHAFRTLRLPVEPAVKQLQKNPLCPFVIRWI